MSAEVSPEPVVRPRVLIVDDDPDIRATMRRVLRKQLDMTFAEGVDQALEVLANTSANFDVALVDWAMPVRTGLELLVEVRDRPFNLPCLIVTAHADLQEVKQASRAKLCRAVIIKPWRPEDILRWVDQIVRLEQSRRSLATLSGILDD